MSLSSMKWPKSRRIRSCSTLKRQLCLPLTLFQSRGQRTNCFILTVRCSQSSSTTSIRRCRGIQSSIKTMKNGGKTLLNSWVQASMLLTRFSRFSTR
ncbi:hypothetical protein FGO68_gene43 [Halteria grandinella]|uniref:Uncharacterized protein n=1 Tax=Halteria grandinella TaxID=5974 RepID=A0A8J8T9U4_HALGN|nr:hypothetical protein FGO68_gene43 [Halteria grandinella]